MKKAPISRPTNCDIPNTTFSGRNTLSASSRWKDESDASYGGGSARSCGASDSRNACHAAAFFVHDSWRPP